MRARKIRKILAIAGVVITPFFLVGVWFCYNPEKDLIVDFLNVGQGDAILIQTPFGQNILIDGGPDDGVIQELGRELPWWDRQIDLMILTHPHDDHVAGLVEVLKRYQVKKILYTGVVHDSPYYLEWLKSVKERHIPLIIADRPQTIDLGQDCFFEILSPNTALAGQEVDNLNNSSIVLKLVYGQIDFLLMGDAEVEVEEDLLSRDLDLSSQILKIGHHGSNTSSSREFLESVRPSIAIVQVGENDFGHPSLRVLSRLERLGARVFRNDTNNTIKLVSNGQIVDLREN